jgi:hypothetical protein
MSKSINGALRRPAAPDIFLSRAKYFALVLAIVQLVHLTVFTYVGAADLVVWLAVNSIAQFALWLLREPARACESYFNVPWKKLAFFFIIALGFKLSSRLPYLQSWLAEGLYATRMNGELGAGGLGSIGSIFFYPVSILLAFCVMPRGVYRWLMAGVILVCCIDFVALGTRNAPMFVLMFHALAIGIRFERKHLVTACLALAGMVAVFGYSTSNRTQESVDDGFDWLVLFEYTGSTEIVKIDRTTVEPIAKALPAALPAIFLSHYVAHSIGELRNLIELSPKLRLGGVYYLKDQICAIGACDRGESLAALEFANPRPGVYQTFWASFVLDFGWIGSIVLFSLVIASMMTAQLLKPRHLGIGTVVFTLIVCLSPIENYFYNGLGLAQALCIFLSYWILNADFRTASPAPANARPGKS